MCRKSWPIRIARKTRSRARDFTASLIREIRAIRGSFHGEIAILLPRSQILAIFLRRAEQGFGLLKWRRLTGEINLSVPGVTVTTTASGQVTINPRISLVVGYQVDGYGLHKTGTLYQSPSLPLPPWQFNLGSLQV